MSKTHEIEKRRKGSLFLSITLIATMLTCAALAQEAEPITIVASGPYVVWGGYENCAPISQGYIHPEDQCGYEFLGSSVTTDTFDGQFPYYIIATDSLFELDYVSITNFGIGNSSNIFCTEFKYVDEYDQDGNLISRLLDGSWEDYFCSSNGGEMASRLVAYDGTKLFIGIPQTIPPGTTNDPDAIYVGAITISRPIPQPTIHLEEQYENLQIWANGREQANFAVSLTDSDGQPIEGRTVILVANPPDGVVIKPVDEKGVPNEPVTGADGIARFTATSMKWGSVTFTAYDNDNPNAEDSLKIDFVKRRAVVFVQGINTRLNKDNDQNIFPIIRERLVASDFRRLLKDSPEAGSDCANDRDDDEDGVPNDGCPLILNYSYKGGSVNPDTGMWLPNDYLEGHTAQKFVKSMDHLASLVEQFSANNPNTNFVIVGHSQGGIFTLHSINYARPPDVIIDSIITLDGALGGTPKLATDIFKVLPPWGGAAAADMVKLWKTVPELLHDHQGTYAIINRYSGLTNAQLVELGWSRGIETMTLGSINDCIFHNSECGIPLPDNSSTQVVENADWGLYALGGNCPDPDLLELGDCVVASHSNILSDFVIIEKIADFVGDPIVFAP